METQRIAGRLAAVGAGIMGALRLARWAVRQTYRPSATAAVRNAVSGLATLLLPDVRLSSASRYDDDLVVFGVLRNDHDSSVQLEGANFLVFHVFHGGTHSEEVYRASELTGLVELAAHEDAEFRVRLVERGSAVLVGVEFVIGGEGIIARSEGEGVAVRQPVNSP